MKNFIKAFLIVVFTTTTMTLTAQGKGIKFRLTMWYTLDENGREITQPRPAVGTITLGAGLGSPVSMIWSVGGREYRVVGDIWKFDKGYPDEPDTYWVSTQGVLSYCFLVGYREDKQKNCVIFYDLHREKRYLF
jgi:hypothetical protein